ncbi:MAG: CHAD domain-containing protein [Chloracidobacterium sp.]|nr:CHAD domain-containing protein [Chloracidobacterium sp.]MDW8217136.1 CHAD domain-containing protein [Acidobacteriota bacterium]
MGKSAAGSSPIAEVATQVSPVEIEIRLALAPDQVRRLRRHPVVRQAPRTRARLRTIYFDTPEAALFKRGLSLRLRRVGRRWVQTVKGWQGAGGVLSRRFEWETPISRQGPALDALPPDIRACLPPEVVSELRPCFETDVWRETWQVVRDETQIEVALDRGEVRGNAQVAPLTEIELELKTGEAIGLFELAEQLATAFPVSLEPRSKAQRGYQLTGAVTPTPVKAVPPTLDFDGPAVLAFQQIVRSCMRQFEANLSGFLNTPDPDPEYVHQMRVALRRMRAAFGLLRFMECSRPDWLGELKWLMGELAAARDWDVFVTETLTRVRTRLEQPERLDELLDVAAALRRAANLRARAAVGSSRLVRLWLKLERELATQPPVVMTATAWLQAALHRRHRQLLRRGERLNSLSPAERHALRIAAKKLRYGAEFFAGRHPKSARRFIRCLADLQDVLGVLNDAAVTMRCLDAIKQNGGPAVWEAAGFVAGFLACEQARRLEELERLWRDFRRAQPYWVGKD